MATAAQIEANKRNAQMSTGPKSASGKARASLNSLKHGERAKVVVPVLPQEDPRELDAKIRRWVEDLQPGDDPERDLVERAARLSWALDRAERTETAGLAVRVRQAQLPSNVETVEKVCDLGRKLLYNAGPRILPVSGPPWETTRPPSCAGSSPPPWAAAGCWSGGLSSARCSGAGPSGRSPTCTGRSACRASTPWTRSTTRS